MSQEKKTDQRCGTCRHFKPRSVMNGVIDAGDCGYPIPAYVVIAIAQIDPRPVRMSPQHGVGCPCWAEAY